MSRILHFGHPAVARGGAAKGVIHVRFAGQSRDLALANLGVDPSASDRQIKRAVALYLEVPADEFSDCVVDRHANGNLTIRPQAVFG